MVNKMANRAWFGFFIIVIIAWVSWYPFYLFKEEAVNASFIKAEQLIRQGQAAYEANNLDDALVYLELADNEYPNYYYPYLLTGDWLWGSGLQLDAIIAYNQALQYNYKLDVAYERIIEFYQSQGMEEQASRYQIVYEDAIKSKQDVN